MQIEPAAHQHLRLTQSGVLTVQTAVANDFALILAAFQSHSLVDPDQGQGEDPSQAHGPESAEGGAHDGTNDDGELNSCCANAPPPETDNVRDIPWQRRAVAFQLRFDLSLEDASDTLGMDDLELSLGGPALQAPAFRSYIATSPNDQSFDQADSMLARGFGSDGHVQQQGLLHDRSKWLAGHDVAPDGLLGRSNVGAGASGAFDPVLQVISNQSAIADKKHWQDTAPPKNDQKTSHGDTKTPYVGTNGVLDGVAPRTGIVPQLVLAAETAVAGLHPDTVPDQLLPVSDLSTSHDGMSLNRQQEAAFSAQRSGSAVLNSRLDHVIMSSLRDAIAAADAGRQIELDMGKDLLGKLRLSIQITDGALLVTLISGRPEALDMFRRNIGLLVQDLSVQGFRDVKIDFGQNLPADPDPAARPRLFSDSQEPEFSKAAQRPVAQIDKRF